MRATGAPEAGAARVAPGAAAPPSLRHGGTGAFLAAVGTKRTDASHAAEKNPAPETNPEAGLLAMRKTCGERSRAVLNTAQAPPYATGPNEA